MKFVAEYARNVVLSRKWKTQMFKNMMYVVSIVAATAAQAQQPAGFDIYLADIDDHKVIAVKNISNRKGYDNQPFFGELGLYYTAAFKSGDSYQTDILFYDSKLNKTKNITKTKVSEYSPTKMRGQNKLSAIVVENDGSQKLWQYPLAAKEQPSRIYQDLAPVGYHAWGQGDELVTFVLGEPHSLYFGNAKQQTATPVAHNIGRTLAYNSTLKQYSFSHYQEESHWLTLFNPKNKSLTALYEFPKSVDYYAWYDDKNVIFAKDNVVYKWQMKNAEPAKKWLDLSSVCATSVSRLNYSKVHSQLAFVCAEKL